jgi:hypothetical protein
VLEAFGPGDVIAWQRRDGPKASRRRLTLPCLRVRERASVTARTRPGGIIALSGATGAFDRPAAALRVTPNRDAVDPRPSGLEDSERGVAEGSGDRDRGGGEPAGARRHFSMQCSCISCGFHAGAGDFSQRNGTPTRSNIGIESRRRGQSEREAARADWPSITLTALAGV